MTKVNKTEIKDIAGKIFLTMLVLCKEKPKQANKQTKSPPHKQKNTSPIQISLISQI